MNALVGSKSKLNFSLFLVSCQLRADNSSRKDHGDFASSAFGRHLGWVCKFDALHDGSRELQLPQIVNLFFPIGWQRRVIVMLFDTYFILMRLRVYETVDNN